MVYWAARQGQVHIIDYLKELGVDLNTQNKVRKSPILIVR